MLQNATSLRKSAPWPPNISHEHVFCTAPATRNASWQILFKCPTPAMVFGNATKPSRFADFWQGAQSLASATRNDIWHLNLQKWRAHVVFCAFWLRNVLRAATACTFSSLIWPDDSAPAALASLLFDPPEPQFRGFSTFSRICTFFLLTLSLLSSSLFCSSLPPASAQLCFPSVHIVGSLTSKLPSIIYIYMSQIYIYTLYIYTLYIYVIYIYTLYIYVIYIYVLYI